MALSNLAAPAKQLLLVTVPLVSALLAYSTWQESSDAGSGESAALASAENDAATAGKTPEVTGASPSEAGMEGIATRIDPDVLATLAGNPESLRNPPIRVSLDDRVALREVHRVARRAEYTFELPDARGGNGTYSWWVAPGFALPAGLHLVRRFGSEGAPWQVTGAVGPYAALGYQITRFRVTSPPAAPIEVDMAFDVVPATYREFRIYTQNTLLRPNNPFVENTAEDNDERARMILQEIRAASPRYDIVALQEVFDNEEKETIEVGATTLGYSAWEGPDGSTGEEDSGLLVLVRRDLVVETYHHEEYRDSAGNDSLAAKGFQILGIRAGDAPHAFLSVVNTHTQAAPDEAPLSRSEVRARQLGQLRAALARWTSPEYAIVVVGDLNVPGDGSEWRNSLQPALGMRDLYRETFPDVGTHPGFTNDTTRNAYAYFWFQGAAYPNRSRYDYVLSQDGWQNRIQVRGIEIFDQEIVTRYHRDRGWASSGRQSFLSDHYGLRAELSLVENRSLGG